MRYPSRIILILIQTLVAFQCVSGKEQNGAFRFTAGFGYDQIKSGWYSTRIDTLAADEDSLLTLRRSYEAVDDLRLKTSLSWTSMGFKKLIFNVNNLNYLSDSHLRNSLGLSMKKGAVTLENNLEARGVWDSDKTGRVGYVSNTVTARLKPELSDGLFLVLRNSFELVRYDGGSDYDLDYDYNRLSIGLEKEFGWTDLVALTYRNDTRVVRDSSRLNYARHRAMFELNWSPTFDISLGLRNELARIESNKDGGLNLDDGWEELIEAEIRLHFGQKWKVKLRNLFDYVAYDTQDVVSFDYTYNRAELSVSRQATSWLELFVAPSVLLFRSVFIEYEQQDYRQFAMEYGVDVLESDRVWITASHKIGWRNYTRSTDEFYTDYVLSQLNLLGDLRIYGNLRLNAIFSMDWEYHDPDENNNSLSLLSAGLDYRFW